MASAIKSAGHTGGPPATTSYKRSSACIARRFRSLVDPNWKRRGNQPMRLAVWAADVARVASGRLPSDAVLRLVYLPTTPEPEYAWCKSPWRSGWTAKYGEKVKSPSLAVRINRPHQPLTSVQYGFWCNPDGPTEMTNRRRQHGGLSAGQW
jgi:hypothetical protein